MINWAQVEGFDWDDGNARKSTTEPEVSQAEAEQAFFNAPLLVLEDRKRSQDEPRRHALGRMDDDRRLHVAFTLRGKGTLARMISARDQSREERTVYARADD